MRSQPLVNAELSTMLADMKMNLLSRTLLTASFVGSLFAVTGNAHASDAKKEALAKAKALAVCKQTFTQALRSCEAAVQARDCYFAADADNIECIAPLGQTGYSDVDIDQSLFTPNVRFAPVVNKFLPSVVCTAGPLNVTCANGHAVHAVCFETIPEQDGGFTREEFSPFQDQNGTNVDTCFNGTPVICPPGFQAIPRSGEDLCWDSLSNASSFRYF